MRNVSYSDGAILTADGCVDAVGTLDSTSCCPIDVCNVDVCSLMCSFIELLPNGPLWDRAKAQGMDRYQQIPCGPACAPATTTCSSLVDYAAYSGMRLASLITGPLWASIRESNPYTAVETIDSWLTLFGWSDPWDSACRDPRLGASPFDCATFELGVDKCDANFSPVYVPDLPPALASAVKRNVVIALSRMQMAPIKNLCGINWIIEPLGAALRPMPAVTVDDCCQGAQFQIYSTSDTIEGLPGANCRDRATRPVNAWYDMPELSYNDATGRCDATGPGTVRVWPAVMAAQVIALSQIQSRDCATPVLRDPVLN